MNVIESSKQCVICLDHLQPGSNCLIFSPIHCDCLVITHLECGTHWLETEKKCIICKQPLSRRDYSHGLFENSSQIIDQLTINQLQFVKKHECRQNCNQRTTILHKFIFYVFIFGSGTAFIYLISMGIQQELPFIHNQTLYPDLLVNVSQNLTSI